MRTEEVSHAELVRHGPQLNHALEVACRSTAFRTSARSCEFLRHVVRHTLAENTAELKERLIGMALLGRDPTYDTGADAGVRVRANDVRKRLAAYYAASATDQEFFIELPPGTYVPRFLRVLPPAAPAAPPPPAAPEPPLRSLQEAPALSLQVLALPTLIAFFLCTVCLRWQIAEEHPFNSFWQTMFATHHVVFYLAPPPDNTRERDDLVALQALKTADPLLQLAGEFNTRFVLESGAPLKNTGSPLVAIGPLTPGSPHVDDRRFTVVDTPGGRRIFDHVTSAALFPVPRRAALLTIFNGAMPSMELDGTDPSAIDSLVRLLAERDSFPDSVANSLEAKDTTQIVFPLVPYAPALVFHEPLQPGTGKAAR